MLIVPPGIEPEEKANSIQKSVSMSPGLKTLIVLLLTASVPDGTLSNPLAPTHSRRLPTS
jgi:hypothetical protein